ncbi:phage tail protein [Acinetobacter soli]|uniref:phage tail protein n=1 Tax=Acinetobacter soli TaxID=487316 RepID=UPI001F317498|nr:phage tail protein [Acinetobacter soli]MCF3127949.1 phage tail protein [Acinetobacter soli]
MANQNEVEVKITASTDSLSDGMNQATNKVQSAANDINRIADSIKTAFDGVRDSLKNIDVSLNVDMSAVQQRLSSAANTIKTQINNIVDDASIKLKIDTTSLSSEIGHAENLIRSRLSSLPIQNVKLDIDIHEIQRRLNSVSGQQVKIKLGLDTSTLQAQLHQAKNSITTTLQSTLLSAIKITVNLPLLAAQLSQAKAMINRALSQLNGSNINLNTVINIDATSTMLRGSLDRLKTSVDHLRNRLSSGGGGGGGSGSGGSGGSSGSGVGTSFLGNFLANIGSELVLQISALTGELIRNARELENMSRLANSTTLEFQEWAFASKSVGISQEKLGDIMKDVNDKFGDFMQTGGGEMKDFFEKIAPKVGVTAKEFQGLSGPQILGKYYETLKKANVSQAEMTFYMESIANDAMLLSPLLENNAQKLKEYSKQAHDLGVILDDKAIQATKEFEAALGLISATIRGLVGRIIAELAPSLKTMADNFLSSATKSKDAIDGSISAIITIFESWAQISQDLFATVGGIWSDLTSDIGDGSLEQISFMDLVSGALKGFGAAAVGLQVGINIAFSAIRVVITTVCQAIAVAINVALNTFGGFRDTIQYSLDILSIKFQTFGSVVKSILSFDFSGASANWDSGLAKIGSITDQYTNKMINRAKDIKTAFNNSALTVSNSLVQAGQNISNSANNGGRKFQLLFLKDPNATEEISKPAKSPTFNANRGIGTGKKDEKEKKPKKGKSDAEREAEREAKALADIRYKYATKEQKIALDLAKALDEIEKSKVTSNEKIAFRVQAEKDASEKIKQLRTDEFEETKQKLEALIEAQEKQAQRSFEISKVQIQADFDAGKISNVEKVKLEKDLYDQLLNERRKYLEKKLALEDQQTAISGKEGKQVQIKSQIADVNADQTISDTQFKGVISDAEMKDFEKKFGGLTSRMSSLWDKGIQSMLNGTLTWKNAMNAIFSELAFEFIQKLVTAPLKEYLKSMGPRLAAKLGLVKAETAVEISGQAAQTGAVVAGEGAKTAATSVGVFARIGLKIMETIKSIMMSAWEAMAKTMASIPFPVNIALGVAAFAGVAALVGKVASARGGYDIPAGVNPMTQLHEEEMVLPKQHANTIRALGKSMANGGFGSGGENTAQPVIFSPTIQAWDSKDVRRFFKKHGSELADSLKGYNRNFGR